WQVGIVLFAIGLAAISSALILVISNLTMPPSEEAALPFPDFEPVSATNVNSGSLLLYQNLVMTDVITPENIKKISHRVKLSGKISVGHLFVKASATERGYDPNRIHTVYIYIND